LRAPAGWLPELENGALTSGSELHVET
jgi:hypothetical protein